MFSPEFSLSKSELSASKELYQLILKIGKMKHVRKGSLLIRAGSHATFFFYIKKGAFKTIVKTTRKNYVLAFTFQDDIDCCPTALLEGHMNNFNIEAITDSEVLICDFNVFQKHFGKEYYRDTVAKILIHYAVFLETQLIESLSLTAEQRYRRLIEQQPEKISMIPLSLIASYLGITLERLSRIRKKMKV